MISNDFSACYCVINFVKTEKDYKQVLLCLKKNNNELFELVTRLLCYAKILVCENVIKTAWSMYRH